MRDALARTALLAQRDVYPGLSLATIADGLAGVTVVLCADEANVSCAAGRTAVVGAAIVLAQSGSRVVLEVADVAFDEPQPPLRGERLATTLAAHLRRLPSGGPPGSPDVLVVFGDTPVPAGTNAPVLRLSGDEFACELESGTTAGRRWRGNAPFGPLLGACALGAEAFRLALRRLGAAHGVEPLCEHRLTPSATVRQALPAFSLPDRASLALDLVSGGAITNGALLALERLAGLEVDGRIFDDDVVAVHNLNRYGLLSLDDVGMAKVDALAAGVPDGWRLDPIVARLTEATAGGGLADHVLVGVDDIPARWLAQRHAPGWLCVAGTSHFEIVVSEHLPGGPCAGCIHPHDAPGDGPIPTVAFVSVLAGLLQAYRLARRAASEPALPPMVVWPMALDSPEGMLSLGESANADCPVGCAASRALGPQAA